MKRLFFLVSILMLVASLQVWADLVLEETVDPGDGSSPVESTAYVTTNRIAIHQGTMGIIFFADKQILWQYDTQQSMYLEFTPASLKGLKAQTDAMVAKAVESLKKQMDSATSDQKASLQKAIDQMQKGPDYAFRRQGSEKTINGFKCTPIEVSINGEAQTEICVASLSELGITAADIKPFDQLQEFYSNLGPMANAGSFSFPGLDKYLGYRSFPVKESEPGAGGMSVTTLKSVRHQKVPEGVYSLPPGLTKQDVLAGN